MYLVRQFFALGLGPSEVCSKPGRIILPACEEYLRAIRGNNAPDPFWLLSHLDQAIRSRGSLCSETTESTLNLPPVFVINPSSNFMAPKSCEFFDGILLHLLRWQEVKASCEGIHFINWLTFLSLV